MAADNPTPDWSDHLLDLPLIHLLALSIPSPALAFDKPAGKCPVAPLAPITDPDALALETSEAPNTAGLVPEMQQALEKFEQLVSSAGGSFDLKSAYRPEAYQAHLQDVWFKWMALRRYRTSGCQALRAQVTAEFVAHKLMPSQKPVSSSDHTRGMAFDAAVMLPWTTASRSRKRRIGVDRLAKLAGLMRPDILRDPVHFKLVVSPTATADSTR